MKLDRAGWAAVVVVCLGGCPGYDEGASRSSHENFGHVLDAGPATNSAEPRAGAPSIQPPWSGPAWPNDADLEDAGADSCEWPSESTQTATREYCDGCGASADATCCVVQGLCCVDTFSELPPLAFDGCTSGGDDCELPAVAFGPAPATYQDGSYVPAPSSSQRSGLAMNGSVDPRDRIRFGARLSASDPAACMGCAELVGVGLATDPLQEDAPNLTPELSIIVSSELSQVVLATGSTTLWSMVIDAKPHDIALERDPEGLAQLYIDGALEAALFVSLPAGPLRPVIFGRSDPSLERAASARIAAAFAGSTRCEATRGWDGPAREVTLADADTTRSQERLAPSVIVLEHARWLAYESHGEIHAVPLDAAGERLRVTGQPGSFAEHVGDPEWVREGDRLALYYTAVNSDGLRSLGRARFGGPTPAGPVEHAQLIAPEEIGARELFGPSVARGPDGNRLLLASALDASGATRLVLLRDAAPAAEPARFEVETARTLLSVDKRALRAEYVALGSADLIHRRGQYQVYFAAAKGGRWSISLLVSTDLRHWLSAGSVISGLAGSGLDDSGVQAPDAVVDGDSFGIYYAGAAPAKPDMQLGTTWRLANVTRTGRAICGGAECAEQTDCAIESRAAIRCGR